jgi:hypothetical protein
MATHSISREIFAELIKLNVNQKRQVLKFVRSLKLPPRASGESLLRFAGTLDFDDSQQMSEAIENGCERIITDEW